MGSQKSGFLVKPLHLKSNSNILLIRTDRIGDVILSTPVASAIKRAFPDSRITFLARRYTRDLLVHHRDIDDVLIEEDLGNGKTAIKKLSELKFDVCIALHPEQKWAWRTYRAGIPVRVGTAYRAFSIFYNYRVFEHRKHSNLHEVDHNLNLLKPFDISSGAVEFRFEIPKNVQEKAQLLLMEKGWEVGQPLLVLHPGSGGSAVDWPAEYFGELARALINQNLTVAVTGTKAEKKLIDRVTEIAGPGLLRLDGELNLLELAGVLNQASVVVANSTGPLHLAVAMGIRVVGLYCPVSPCHPERWGPYGQADSVLVPEDVSCKSCNPKKCAEIRCMEQISVEMVLKKVMEQLTDYQKKKVG